MTSDRESFSSFKRFARPVEVTIGDGRMVKAIGEGSVPVEIFNGKNWTEYFLKSAWYVPK